MRNFFKGISITSLAAGALAAVTSFLLSAKIGIAGSVIGVAAGSVVSAVATQIYKNVLSASGEKLQNVAVSKTGPSDDADATGTDDSAHDSLDDSANAGTANDTTPDDDSANVTQTAPIPDGMLRAEPEARIIGSDMAASVLGGIDDAAVTPRVIVSGETGREGLSDAGRGNGSHRSASADARAAGTRQKRIAIIIAVASALIAVGITAGIIMLATQGQGTDSVVRDWVGQTSQTPRPDDAGYGNGTDDPGTDGNTKPSENPQGGTSDESGTNGESNGDTSDSGTSNDGTSGTDSTGGSSDSSTSGNGGSTGGSTGGSASTDSGGTGSGTVDGSTGSAGSDSGTTDGSNGSSGSTDGDGNGTGADATTGGTSSGTSSGAGSTGGQASSSRAGVSGFTK